MGQNQAMDWLRGYSRQMNPVDGGGAGSTVSLHSSQRGGNRPLEEKIQDESEFFDELTDYIEKVLGGLDDIPDQRKRWILRLSILSILPMEEREFSALAEAGGLQVGEVKKRIGRISVEIEEKEEEKEARLGRAIVLWQQIQRAEAMLLEKSRDLSLEGKRQVEKLKEKISKKSKRREKLLYDGQRFIRPSNQDIAELVGIPEGKVAQVSTLLIRARKSFRKISGP